MIPAAVTLAILEEELAVAQEWATAHDWQLSLDEEALTLYGARAHPADGEPLLLQAVCDQYRALPPAWMFVDPLTRQPTPAATPTRDNVNGRASVIYGVGVICAHFSRTAYKQHHSGPHDNWGELTAWEQVAEGVQAHTIVEMLAVIDGHLRWSEGRLA